MVFHTTLDLLYFSLTIFVGCMTVLISLILIKIIRMMSHVQRIVAVLKETSELINEYAWKPVEIFIYLKEYLEQYMLKGKKK